MLLAAAESENGWPEINLGSSDNSYDKLCAVLPIWVAIYCTVFDLCIWGYTWNGLALKNNGMNSSFQCPTITKPTCMDNSSVSEK